MENEKRDYCSIPWTLSKEQIAEEYSTNLRLGLSSMQAELKLKEEGLNEIPTASHSFYRTYLRPLFSWLIIIYLIASGIMLIVGIITHETNMTMIYITLAIVALNAIVAVMQQARANKKLKALRSLSAPTTLVIRDGEKIEILTQDLVVGDLIVLDTGSKIPADARIIEGVNLNVNEASLTGESEPVKKNHGELLKKSDLRIHNRENMLFYGTFISTGHAKAILTAVGPNTEIGKISIGIQESETGEIPIQKKLNSIGKWFGFGVMGIWLLVILILFITTGKVEIIKSLNSAMDIMPINIPLLTTIIMITGVLGMAKQGMIVKNLTAVDSLGRVSVVCSDKTGTLTKSQMCVQHIWVRGSHFTVSGTGYNPIGEIFLVDNPNKPEKVNNLENYPHLKLLIEAGYLNNNSELIKHEFLIGKKVCSDWKIVGSQTEGALKVLAHKIGIHQGGPLSIDLKYHYIMEFPFSSKLKRMTKVFEDKSGEKSETKSSTNGSTQYCAFIKGSSEYLISSCPKLLAEEKKPVDFVDEMKLVIMNEIYKFASDGYRILSLAYKPLEKIPTETEEGRAFCESDMIYIGFVAIMDPPRDGVKDSIQKCHSAGIDVVMITGDSKPTAMAIASQIGMLNTQKNHVMDGNRLKNLKPDDDISKVGVFSRVSPEDKQKIVQNYQNHSRVVAMTGDGVNDALALNMADAGISMGIQGTDVAKESADMILSDDSFNSIVHGIHQGRGIFANIRSVVFFFICINLFEGIVQFILAVILEKPYFLDAQFMYMWIFLSLTLHTLPGFILTFDTISNDVMKEKPRDSEEILPKSIISLMVLYGILLGLSMLVTYFLVMGNFYPVFTANTNFPNFLQGEYLYTTETMYLTPNVNLISAKALTMLMCTLFFCESTLALQIRRPNKSLWKSVKHDGNIFMYIIIIILFGIFILLMYFPGLQVGLAKNGINFGFMNLTFLDWLICLGSASICIGSFELVKWICRKKGIVF